ncbi:MAG: hypothetical protein QG647_808 [Patescibacteria group bacterium]|nr:hypothetical protein [Patescibacteria group bacterium]
MVTYNKAYVIEKIGNRAKSNKTRGEYILIIAKDLETGKSYKTYADTTIKSFNAWERLKVNDKFTGVKVYNETNKILAGGDSPILISRNQTYICETCGQTVDKG